MSGWAGMFGGAQMSGLCLMLNLLLSSDFYTSRWLKQGHKTVMQSCNAWLLLKIHCCGHVCNKVDSTKQFFQSLLQCSVNHLQRDSRVCHTERWLEWSPATVFSTHRSHKPTNTLWLLYRRLLSSHNSWVSSFFFLLRKSWRGSLVQLCVW